MATIVFDFQCPNHNEFRCDGNLIDVPVPDTKKYMQSFECDKCGCRLNVAHMKGPKLETDANGKKFARFEWPIEIQNKVESLSLSVKVENETSDDGKEK